MSAPATVWTPPPGATGDRWRVWLRAAIRDAFLPAGGRILDLTAQLRSGEAVQNSAGMDPIHPTGNPTANGSPVTPFWATMLDACSPGLPDRQPAAGRPSCAAAPTVPGKDPAGEDPGGVLASDTIGVVEVDLVVVELGATLADDRLGMLAARALRGGGILAALTHCGHLDPTAREETAARHVDGPPRTGCGTARTDRADAGGGVGLVDPAGSVVASAQNADLLYLQHIVIPRHPLTPPEAGPRRSGAGTACGPRRGWRHRIAHIDLQVFRATDRQIPAPTLTSGCDGPDAGGPANAEKATSIVLPGRSGADPDAP